LAIAGCVEELEEGRFCGQTRVKVWNTKDPGVKPRELNVEIDFISFLVFSPDSRWLVISDASGVVPWDLKDSSATPEILRDHSDGIYAMLFSPDSKWLATGSHDSTVRLLNMQQISIDPIVLSGHQDTIRAMAFSPDGQLLVTGSDDMTARLWMMDTSRLMQSACRFVGRNLTLDEWTQTFPGQQYRKTCDQWLSETEVTLTPQDSPTP
jgi:WD40 repeat protein